VRISNEKKQVRDFSSELISFSGVTVVNQLLIIGTTKNFLIKDIHTLYTCGSIKTNYLLHGMIGSKINELTISCDGKRLRVLNIKTGEILRESDISIFPYIISFCPVNNESFCSLHIDNSFIFWSNTLHKKKLIKEHNFKVVGVVQVKEDFFASADEKGTLIIWGENLESTQTILTGEDLSMIISWENSIVVLGQKNGWLAFWNINEGLKLKNIKADDYPISSLAKLSKNKIVAACETTIKIFNINEGNCIGIIKEHKEPITSLLIIKSRFKESLFSDSDNDEEDE
jgi:hypothetical protein